MADARTPEKSRSLLPKEHGAYAQLLGPLLVALVLARFERSAVLIAAGAVLAFLAHEPLLVLLGQRGKRAEEQDGARARGRALLLLALAAMAGLGGLSLGLPLALVSSVVPVVLGGALALLIRAKLEKTLGGEILAAIALTSASLPVMLAAGVMLDVALWASFAFALGFTATTVAVRGVIAHAKGRRVIPPKLLLAILTAVEAAAIALAGRPALGALPLVLSSWVLVVLPPSPRHLRTVGYVLVGATLLSGAVVLWA